MTGLASITTADIMEFVGFAWTVIPAAFFGGFLYLRSRTLHENLF